MQKGTTRVVFGKGKVANKIQFKDKIITFARAQK
jgi:hypothetical protein